MRSQKLVFFVNRCRETYFAGPFDSFPNAKITENPDQEQSSSQFPSDAPHVLDSCWDLERSSSVNSHRGQQSQQRQQSLSDKANVR